MAEQDVIRERALSEKVDLLITQMALLQSRVEQLERTDCLDVAYEGSE